MPNFGLFQIIGYKKANIILNTAQCRHPIHLFYNIVKLKPKLNIFNFSRSKIHNFINTTHAFCLKRKEKATVFNCIHFTIVDPLHNIHIPCSVSVSL